MSREFVYLAADRVIYGAGALAHLPQQMDRLEAQRAFVVTGQTIADKTGLLDRVKGLLGRRLSGVYPRAGEHVPRSRVLEAAQAAAEARADCLISLGGGSPVDTTKGVALALAEGIKRPEDFGPYSTRFVAAEGPKRPFARNPPSPTSPLPPLTDPLCLEAIRLLSRFLPISTRGLHDLDARLSCQLAAWLSIYGAFNAPVGLSHAIGHQLGGRCGVPHGITSCITLARVMAYNAPAAPERMAAIAEAMSAADAPAAVDAFVKSLELPTRLSETGKVKEADLEPLAHETFAELRPGHNPRPVRSAQEILEILRSVW